MGLVLGITLGIIGFFRGAATSEDLRSAKRDLEEPMQVAVPNDSALDVDADGRFVLPVGTLMAVREPVKRRTLVASPPDAQPDRTTNAEQLVYTFPKDTVLRTETVSRWHFAWVIALSVAFICLWGTIIGSMLPLAFHQLGADPALASSPFVATFVDVTGIFAYFSIATLILF
jgi:magnesium transporter